MRTNAVKYWSMPPASGLSSPSKLLIAGLVALLLAGYGTDWKIVFGRSPSPKPQSRFGATETAVGFHRTRQLRQGAAANPESNAELADSRAPTSDR